ncbi:MAG: DUF2249 domain-containing protein [Burkholderiales bacterium]|nr:DUF2249 domain-containing protein [Burkholderiales bacterium]MDE1929568.1 DUF2249 domain-containing protein [Burkholderiales bacterium]MDE2503522.1 DUF2249 domain-containing protein [Burkholderiales bacterium]
MSTPVATTRIDVREIAPYQRHALIFERFDALEPGQALELVADHDPRPLRAQFEARSPRGFDWSYLEAGPALWRLQITRLAAGGSCCSGGACSG